MEAYTQIYIFIEILVSKFQLSNYTEKKQNKQKYIYYIPQPKLYDRIEQNKQINECSISARLAFFF